MPYNLRVRSIGKPTSLSLTHTHHTCRTILIAALHLQAHISHTFCHTRTRAPPSLLRSIGNAYIPVIAAGSSVSVSMALFNSVGNLGGILGPWIIGVVVERTGTYDVAIQLLSAAMLTAAVMAWHTRHWEELTSARAAVLAIHNARSMGADLSLLKDTRM